MHDILDKIWAWYDSIGLSHWCNQNPDTTKFVPDDSIPYLRFTSAREHAVEMKDVLIKVLNAGTWFLSALEIDQHMTNLTVEKNWNG